MSDSLAIKIVKLKGGEKRTYEERLDKWGTDYWPVTFSHVSFGTCEREVISYFSNPPRTEIKIGPAISLEISGQKITIEQSAAAELLFNVDASQRKAGIRSMKVAQIFLAAKSWLRPSAPKGTAGAFLPPARIHHRDGKYLYIQTSRRPTLRDRSTVDIYCVPRIIRDVFYTAKPQ